MHCAPMKLGTSESAIPVNVGVSTRASVTAGFANDVDDVNQYPAVMNRPLRNGDSRSVAEARTSRAGEMRPRGPVVLQVREEKEYGALKGLLPKSTWPLHPLMSSPTCMRFACWHVSTPLVTFKGVETAPLSHLAAFRDRSRFV